MIPCPRLAVTGACLVLLAAAVPAHAAGIAYLSSSSGFVLGGGGNASTAKWSGQAPLEGFGGYGTVKWNGRCLAGRTGGQPLTWETCKGDAAQKWGLTGKRLNNESGWCADVEGNRAGAGVRVLAYKCSGAINQQWNAHHMMTKQQVAAGIADAKARATFLSSESAAAIGALISLVTGKIISNDGASLIGQDGGGFAAKTSNGLLVKGN